MTAPGPAVPARVGAGQVMAVRSWMKMLMASRVGVWHLSLKTTTKVL